MHREENTNVQAGEAWHAMTVDEVESALGTDVQRGLRSEEAARRVEIYGPNSVSRGRRRRYVEMFFSQFTDPLVIVLLGAAIITFALGHYVDTGVIMAVVIINAVIGFIQEGKAESAIESLSKMLTVEATVVRDGDTDRIPSEQLVPGDVVYLQSGDKVPADTRLSSKKGIQVDESVLTGESAPVSKSTEPVEAHDAVSDRTCMAYSGTLVTAGLAHGIVVATGDNTQIGLISSLISEAPRIATPLTRKLAIFGRWLSFVVLGVAAITFVLGIALGQVAVDMFTAAVAIAVAMIPEGLPAIVTIVLAVGVKRMAIRNAIIRNLPSVETLGSVTVIGSDKTGTLTANEMTVRRAYSGGLNFEFAGVGYDPTLCCVVPSDTAEDGLGGHPFIETMRCGLLCNESELKEEDGRWLPVGDPTEVALIVAALKAGLDHTREREAYPRLDVIPFESDAMYMATLNANPDGGATIYVKGSTERVLGMCTKQLCEDGERDLDPDRILGRAEDLAVQGFRLLSFARKVLPGGKTELNSVDMHDLVFLGLQAMSDPPRPEAIEAIDECRAAGIEVKMITGDHVTTAMAIARELGLADGRVKALSGSELANLTEEEFRREALDTRVFARVAPEQKYRLVEALQAHGNVVAMTGDGVNDAPALKKADIGVAMGRTGSEVAKDASDMVLTDDNFASIVAAVEEGRTVFANLVKTLAFVLPTNAGEGLVIIAALLGGYALPVTPVQILWINTVTAVTLALPLAFEPKEPGLMRRPPRKPDAPILSNDLIFRIGLVAAVMVAGTFGIFWFERSEGALIQEARTAAVATIVMYEVFYLFSARSQYEPVWKMSLAGNPYIWGGVFLVLLLQLAFTYLPVLNFFFGSTPIDWFVWWRILLVTFPIVIIVGIEKSIRQRFGSQGQES